MDIYKQYPGIKPYLDDTDDYINKATEFIINDNTCSSPRRVQPTAGRFHSGHMVDGWVAVYASTGVRKNEGFSPRERLPEMSLLPFAKRDRMGGVAHIDHRIYGFDAARRRGARSGKSNYARPTERISH